MKYGKTAAFIHKTAEVHSKKIGKDKKIWQYVVILEGAQIGENCNKIITNAKVTGTNFKLTLNRK